MEKDWNLRRLALLTLPALLVGLFLRAMLMVDLPYGSIHPDSDDLLLTPDRLIQKGQWSLHPKKTFLAPVLYTAAFAVPKVPVLIAIPLAQHLLGLATVAIAALLCRLWLRHWQWIVVPVTMLLAVNPALIWFEHALMTETLFVFCTALLALAGTLYALRPEKRTFAFLCVALVLEAGARPEGKLLFAFGFLLIFLVAWPQWRKALRPLGILLLVVIPTSFATRTNQAGLLLYTSLLRIAPETSNVAPGVENYTAPIRTDLQTQWAAHPAYPRSAQRNELAKALSAYLKERHLPSGNTQTDSLCKRLAKEAFLQQAPELPGLVLHKWRCTALRPPSEDFSDTNLAGHRDRAVQNASALIIRNAQALVGQPLEDEAEAEAFFDSAKAAAKASWLNQWSERWFQFFGAWRTPDTRYPDGFVEQGLPFYMLFAFCGLALLACRPPRAFHIAWGLALVGLFLVVLLTANVRPRFRLFFEPYWLLAWAAILDTATMLALRCFKRS